MSGATRVSFRVPVLAWAAAGPDELRFRRVLRRVMGVGVVVCAVLPWLPVQTVQTAPRAAPPPQRLARLLIEPATPAPPPAPRALPEMRREAPRAQPVPAREAPPLAKAPPAVAARQAAPAARGAPVPEARDPQPDKAPGEALAAARRAAAGVGLLAMKDELAEMRGAPLAVQINREIRQGPGVGSGSGPGVGAGTAAGVPVRALLTSNARGGSGGINTAAYSRDTGGGGLAGRATTVVEGVAGGGGGGGRGGGGFGGKGDGAGAGGAAAGGSLQRAGNGKASRSIEEIKLVFERHKGAIYALYNRALREDASLQGKVVLELKIAPGGEVVDCRIVSSELHAEALENKLLARIRQFDFGAKDVETMVVSWPVDFLPS